MDRSIDEVLKVNSAALDFLSKGDRYSAQQLFRESVKRHPCFLTMHNLGNFYVEEGIVPKGKEQARYATRLGIRYLFRAASTERSALNLTAIGDAYLEIKEYHNAIHYFEGALDSTFGPVSNYRFYNNYGAALYSAGYYEAAASRFHEAFDCCGYRDDRFAINVSHAFALQKVDLTKCREAAQEMLSRVDEYNAQMLLVKVFILLYLCHDFQSAYAISASLCEEYHLDSSLIAMVLDCLMELGKTEEARERLRLQIEDLEGYEYDTREEMRNARMALKSREHRKKLIADYRYIPPKLAQCYYLGCPEHNPLRTNTPLSTT